MCSDTCHHSGRCSAAESSRSDLCGWHRSAFEMFWRRGDAVPTPLGSGNPIVGFPPPPPCLQIPGEFLGTRRYSEEYRTGWKRQRRKHLDRNCPPIKKLEKPIFLGSTPAASNLFKPLTITSFTRNQSRVDWYILGTAINRQAASHWRLGSYCSDVGPTPAASTLHLSQWLSSRARDIGAIGPESLSLGS